MVEIKLRNVANAAANAEIARARPFFFMKIKTQSVKQ